MDAPAPASGDASAGIVSPDAARVIGAGAAEALQIALANVRASQAALEDFAVEVLALPGSMGPGGDAP